MMAARPARDHKPRAGRAQELRAINGSGSAMIFPSRNQGLAAALLSGFVSAAGGAGHLPPMPFYNSNVENIDRIGDGSIVIQTRDSPSTVQTWYRKHLCDSNGETITGSGGRI